MKFLHTSDWHLGVSLEQAPRQEEHRRFLDWLLERCAAERIDAILVSGDVFHYMQPSASAQRDFFAFLARAAAETSVRTVVLTAGNHDSPSRFDAPREILAALDVKVVGTIGEGDAAFDCLVPLSNADGEVEIVVAAVPFLSEARLGVSTTQGTTAEIARKYQDAFAELHANLRAEARRRYGDAVGLVVMGHMTCVPAGGTTLEGDFQTPIHHFGGAGGLTPDIFDGWDYAALGHIHRHHQVGDSKAWYPGTPVPTNVIESRTPRYVMQVQWRDDAMRARPVRLPRWREVYEIIGFEEEIAELIRSLTWDSELAPYLYVERLVTTPTRAGVDRFQNLVTQQFDEPRPRIVGFKKRLVSDAGLTKPKPANRPRPLDELSIEEVFGLMYRLKHEAEAPDNVMAAFRSLLVSDEDEDVPTAPEPLPLERAAQDSTEGP